MSDLRYCAFTVGDVELALRATDVEEVTRHATVTPVPMAPAAVRGLAHLRGRIIPVIGLRACLCLEGGEPAADPVHLVAHTADGPVSLEVDRLLDVVEGDASRLLAAPDTLGAALRRCVAAALPFPDRLLLVLDLARVLAQSVGDPRPAAAGGTA